jgi:cysteine desulfurase family protein
LRQINFKSNLNKKMNKVIYFDNAATSWPKPPQMFEAVCRFNDEIGANSGRSGHQRSVQSARIVYETRQRLADLFNLRDPLRVVFTSNVTESINLVLNGLLKPADHVITTSMEHNAVMRPLRYLETQGVELSIIPCSSIGECDPADIKKLIKSNSKLIVINHASNVIGTIFPVREVGRIARENGLLMLVDAAQTAGAIPIDMEADHIDFLAFTGHKSLYGPMGTGGLLIGDRVDVGKLHPLKRGGTGSYSEFEDQPDFLPDKYESGTLNVLGLAGLKASLAWIQSIGVEIIREHEKVLCQQLINGLQRIPGIKVFGSKEANLQTAVVSFIVDGFDNAKMGEILDREYGVLCRIGLHCAPSAHRSIQTFPNGTIRFSFGYFNSIEEIDSVLMYLREITERKQ